MPEGGGGRRPERGRPIGWVLAIAWALLILAISSIPEIGDRLPEMLRFRYSDKIAHALAYGVFGAFLALAIGRWWPALLIASAFGAVDELYQATVPGRQPNVRDWIADTLGAAAGASLTLVFIRRRRRRAVP